MLSSERLYSLWLHVDALDINNYLVKKVRDLTRAQRKALKSLEGHNQKMFQRNLILVQVLQIQVFPFESHDPLGLSLFRQQTCFLTLMQYFKIHLHLHLQYFKKVSFFFFNTLTTFECERLTTAVYYPKASVIYKKTYAKGKRTCSGNVPQYVRPGDVHNKMATPPMMHCACHVCEKILFSSTTDSKRETTNI